MKSGTDIGEIIFSGEKRFNVEAVFNRQNDRILAKSSVDILDSMRKAYRRRKPCSVMVRTAVSKTLKFLPIFFHKALKSIQFVHWDNLDFCPCRGSEILQAKAVHSPTRRCAITHVLENSGMVQETFSLFVEQGSLAALIARLESNGLLCLVHFQSRCLCFIPWFSSGIERFYQESMGQKILQKNLRKADSFRCKLARVIQARGGHSE